MSTTTERIDTDGRCPYCLAHDIQTKTIPTRAALPGQVIADIDVGGAVLRGVLCGDCVSEGVEGTKVEG